MRILMIHNAYGRTSGEEAMFNRIAALLRSHDHSVECSCRSSAELTGLVGKSRAFFKGIYSFSSRAAMRRLLQENRPDVIYVQNVFPLISPSVLLEAHEHQVAIVMRCANYRLICPNGLMMRRSSLCDECLGGREYRCMLHNCEGHLAKSIGYALRNYVARKARFFLDTVTVYYCSTEFQRERMIAEGFPAGRFDVIPNMVDCDDIAPSAGIGDYVGYAGRVSPEKGIQALLAAAKGIPEVPFRIAGAYERMPHIVRQAPSNVEFLGNLDSTALDRFYRGCRILVLPSVWYETFGLVLAEAAVRGKPVVSSRMGGLGEIVQDGLTGLLCEPGEAVDLRKKLLYLWQRPQLCRQMGLAGRQKVLREYSPEVYYTRLMRVFQKAIEINGNGCNPEIEEPLACAK